jgi:hypothetical protein
MSYLVFGVDENIVQVGDTEVIEVVNQYVVHIPLVGSWAIAQAEWKNLTLVRTVAGSEGSILLRIGVHSNPVESSSNIKLGEELGFGGSRQQLVNTGYQIGVLASDSVKLPIVHTDSKVTIGFSNTEDRRCEWAPAMLDESFL